MPEKRSTLEQALLLLWKNVLLQLRSYIITICILILSVGCAALVVWMRTLVDNEVFAEPFVFRPFPIFPWNEFSNVMPPAGSTQFDVYVYPENDFTSTVAAAANRYAIYKPTPSGIMNGHNMTNNGTFDEQFFDFSNNTNINDTSSVYDTQILNFIPTNNLEDIMSMLERQVWENSNKLGLVEFTNNFPATGEPGELDLVIRLSHSFRYGYFPPERNPQLQKWQTENMYPRRKEQGPRGGPSAFTGVGPPGYNEEGFLGIQLAINLGIMSAAGHDVAIDDYQVLMNRIPYPPYVNNIYMQVISNIFPLLFVIAMIPLVLTVTKQLVLEKEKRLKEAMKMMGLSPWLHNVCWLIHFMLVFGIVAIIVAALLIVKIVSQGAVLSYSSVFGVAVFLFIYSIQSIAVCFFLSSCFSKANSAAVLTGVGWFVSYFAFLWITPNNPDSFYLYLGQGNVLLLCFIPNIALGFNTVIMTDLEARGIGLTMFTLDEWMSFDDNLTIGAIFMVQILSSVMWFVLAWYIESVLPGEFGVAQKPWFIFMLSYWTGKTAGDDNNDDYNRYKKEKLEENENFEEDPDLPAGITIVNLSKTYGNGKFAVKGITMKMFKGQITAFLGHNGAGKTSTISMLTGLYNPSGGTAYINDLNIRTEMELIRTNLGICPQHDVLYDNLTVREHLSFFCKLKGMDSDKIEAETKSLLEDLELSKKINAKVCQLSGGMKRKLSVAIAFCGGSNVVLLDEPTTGMDPSARRVTWDLIQKYREGRTIILTTHYMDEADFLGDRIAIMSSGKIVCAGSSMFLKNRYGIGYHMITEKMPKCNPNEVEAFISKYVPDMEKESNVGAELSFRLPHQSVSSFPAMFEALEKEKGKLGIASYGVSVTTLEEVFLRVGHLNEDDEMDHSYSSASTKPLRDAENGKANEAYVMNGELEAIASGYVEKPNDESSFSTIPPFTVVERYTGFKLWFQQFKALLLKRMINTWRSRAVSISQLVVPVLLTSLALMVLVLFVPADGNLTALQLKLDDYDDTKVSFFDRQHGSDLVVDYTNTINDYASKSVMKNGSSATEFVDYLSNTGAGMITDQFNHEYIVGASFEESDDGKQILTAWFNGEPYHSAPLSLQLMLNALMRDKLDAAPIVRVTNHPLPMTIQEQNKEADQPSIDGAILSFYCAGMGLGFLMASFSVFLIRERATKSKHIQFVSGVHASTYWMSTFIWDLTNFAAPAFCIIALLYVFQLESWMGEPAGMFAIVLFMYAWAILPMMYLSSFVSTVPPNGFLVMGLLNVVGTIGFSIAYLIIGSLREGPDDNDSMNTLINIGFLLPQFCIGASLADISKNRAYRDIPLVPGQPPMHTSYFSWEEPGIGRWLTFMAIEGVIYFTIIACVEIGLLRILQNLCCSCLCFVQRKRIANKEKAEAMKESEDNLDSDVAAEKQRLQSGTSLNADKPDTLVVKGVSKTYRSAVGTPLIQAVKELNLGIPAGECFGLLGVNGAGKSTTFNMLTGDILIDEGTASLEGISLRNNIVEARQLMGYCPQFDALIDQMTGKETLAMYGRFRGIPEDKLDMVIKELMDALQLTVYANKAVGTYSGGNKRKISTAIALIGCPPIAFLDEPSSGMDPVTRRRLWNVLSRVREDGRSIVITSHSMEECEALCTRLAIMVNGQFKCLGALQHLKTKYGNGFTLVCKTRNTDPAVNNAANLKAFIETTYPEAVMKDGHIQGVTGYLHYELRGQTQTWANLFETIERVKSQFNVCDYIISQTTLEQIFLNFAREQKVDNRQN